MSGETKYSGVSLTRSLFSSMVRSGRTRSEKCQFLWILKVFGQNGPKWMQSGIHIPLTKEFRPNLPLLQNIGEKSQILGNLNGLHKFAGLADIGQIYRITVGVRKEESYKSFKWV